MAIYPPPTYQEPLPIFNTIYWEEDATVIDNTFLNANFLRFPVAQGTETFPFSPLCVATQPAADDSSNIMPTTAWVQSAIVDAGLVGGSVPTGCIIAYAGLTPPVGFLFCNGASVSTTTYGSLFTAIGYSYGGAGASFNVPNLTNSAPFGSNTTSVMGLAYANGNSISTLISGGNSTILANQLAPHSHTITFATASYVDSTNNANNTTVGGFDARLVSKATAAFPAGTNNQTFTTAGQESYLPPFVAVQYIIKT